MSTTIEMLVARVEELEKQMSQVMAKTGLEKPKKEKPKKDKSDEPKKKRGVSGYLVYAKEMRPTAKDKLLENGNETPKPTEVLTQVAKMWRELSEEDKSEWNDKAKAINSASEDEEDSDAKEDVDVKENKTEEEAQEEAEKEIEEEAQEEAEEEIEVIEKPVKKKQSKKSKKKDN